MVYSTGYPDPSDSPAEFPAQASRNWVRLKAAIETDHNFDLTTTSTLDGWHKVIQLSPQATPGSSVGLGKMYGKVNGNIAPHYRYPDTGSLGAVPECIVPTVAAYGIFQGRSTAGACASLGQVHSCSCSYVSSGGIGISNYNVKFTTALPDSNYIPYVVNRNSLSSTVSGVNIIDSQNFQFRGSSDGSAYFGVIVYYLAPA